MLYHYLKVAYRVLIKNNIYSLISVFGLSIAMCITFIIAGHIIFQLSFDKYHESYGKIYRVIKINKNYSDFKEPNSPFILATTLKNNFPEVKEVARIANLPFQIGGVKIRKNDEFINELDFYSADQELFSILNIPIKRKSTEKVLSDPYNVVISESMANKYYGKDNPLGKMLSIRTRGKSLALKVTGIMYDFPENSSIKADFFCTTDLYIKICPERHDKEAIRNSWEESFFSIFILFKEGVDMNKFESKLNKTLTNFYDENDIQFQFQNLGDIHFYSSEIKNDNYLKWGM